VPQETIGLSDRDRRVSAYYNEFDPFAAAWLRELIKAGLIAPGDVDERSITEVEPGDLRGYTQCHFFAGIGVWSYALRAAGWSDDTPVWTGSCPCQSFSASGKRGGFSDQRHLWPAWFRLIRECHPNVCFGEQVASKDGLAWLDVVSSDMEGEGYAFGQADTCAAGFGAPHIRQRMYFVADAEQRGRHDRGRLYWGCTEEGEGIEAPVGSKLRVETQGSRSSGELAHSGRTRSLPGTHGRVCSSEESRGPRDAELERRGDLGHADERGSQGQPELTGASGDQLLTRPTGLTNGFWENAEWIYCRDGKYRPVEPGTFPLAHGATSRVGRLRGYGNALNAEQAKGFIQAYREVVAATQEN
jgi:DNA (cytosine-5)-methyltransferase 1